MRGGIGAVLVLFAACSGPIRQTGLSGSNGVCATQVEQDPRVRAILARGAAVPEYYADHQGELQEARRQSEIACLRRLGLAPPGGVEAPKQRNSLFQGF
ncbi:MAG: hypothetical protein JO110_05315 [Acetobacteraceae bacterium]|nr:hypothetical protein [Acetobacteraceae bacterium]